MGLKYLFILAALLPQAGAALAPLGTEPPDPGRGFALLVSSEGGNCLTCHHLSDPRIPEGFTGDLGPPLDGIGSLLSAAQIRQQIADPRALDLESLMPGYFVTEGLTNVAELYRGKPYLSGQEIDDITAFLESLK